MKRILLICIMLMSSLASLTTRGHHIEFNILQPLKQNETTFEFVSGEVSGKTGTIVMNGTTGTLYNYDTKKTHKLKLVSYNKGTGKLILKEYDSRGRYVGQFVGTYTLYYVVRDGYDQKWVLAKDLESWDEVCWEEEYYSGIYTNKRGRKTKFSFSAGG